MLSIINAGILRCSQTNSSIWDKAAYIDKYLPWVDFALAIILIVIGSLASNGVFFMAGSEWMVAIGSIQLILVAIQSCSTCCHTCFHGIRDRYFNSDIRDDEQPEFLEGFSDRLLAVLPGNFN